MAPIMAFFSMLFFKKKEPAYIKHYVMMVYSLTTFSLFAIALLPIMVQVETTESFWTFLIGVPLMFAFLGWAMIDYLKLKGFSEYLQAGLALLFGYILYSIVSGILLYIGAYLKLVL